MDDNTHAADQLHLPIVRSEVNFLNFPFFCLAKSELSSTTSIEYHSTIRRDGQKVDISWEVLAHPKFGFPGPFDKDVQKAVEALITQRGFPIANPVPFSTYNVCKIMGINPRSGKNRQAVKEALLRLASTSVHSKQAFYSKADGQWIEELFHLYDYVIFKGKPRPDSHETADTNYLFLGKWYLDNLNSFYIKHLDYDFYKSLASPTEKRYYEIMSVKFYGAFRSRAPFLRYRYSTLCSLFPLARQPYLSLAKQQLNPSHKKLIEQGFFRKVTWHKTSDKGDWLLYFYSGARANELLNPERLLDDAEIGSLGDFDADSGQLKFSFAGGGENEGQNSRDKYYKYYKYNNNRANHNSQAGTQSVVVIFDNLKTLGLPEQLARKYMEKYPAGYIEEKIAIVKFKKSKDQQIKNSGGMLRKAIEENWQPPEDLTAAAERQVKDTVAQQRRQEFEKQTLLDLACDKAAQRWKEKASEKLLSEIHKRSAREIKAEHPGVNKNFLKLGIKIRENEIIVKEYLDAKNNLENR